MKIYVVKTESKNEFVSPDEDKAMSFFRDLTKKFEPLLVYLEEWDEGKLSDSYDSKQYIEQIFGNVLSDLRLSGYSSVSYDFENVRRRLLLKFKRLIFIEINDLKTYYISSDSGKKLVLRFLDNSIYYEKRSMDRYGAQKIPDSDPNKLEYDRLMNLRKVLLSHKF